MSLNDVQRQELLDFVIKYNDIIMSSSELNEVFSSEISIKDLIRIAEYFNVSTDYILERTNKKEVNK